MANPLYISFCSQKGGVGKTTFTVLAASYLHYSMGYNVAVIDCDFPQHSIVKFREREKKQIALIPEFNALAHDQFQSIGKTVYPVIKGDVRRALLSAEELWSKSTTKYDVIFFDFPGTVNTPGLIESVSGMDFLFTPIEADRLILESSLEFAFMLNEIFNKQGKTEQVYLFWNKVDGRERTPLYLEYEKLIKDIGLPLLTSRMPASAKFKKEVESEAKTIFRSTIFPVSKLAQKGTSIDMPLFMQEVSTILKIK